jgi:hypothetical protein
MRAMINGVINGSGLDVGTALNCLAIAVDEAVQGCARSARYVSSTPSEIGVVGVMLGGFDAC